MRKNFVKDIKDRDQLKEVFLVKEKITAMAKNGKPYLKAENPKYPDLIPAQELVIQGVFKALIRKAD